MTFLAIGAAMVFPTRDCPRPPPFSTTTATATWGSFAGAKPVNQRVYGWLPSPFWAVPVLPATSTPLILALLATPLATLFTINWVMVAATVLDTGCPYGVGANFFSTDRSGAVMLSIRVGVIRVPPLAIAAETMAIWSGVTRSLPCPNDESSCWASSLVCG